MNAGAIFVTDVTDPEDTTVVTSYKLLTGKQAQELVTQYIRDLRKPYINQELRLSKKNELLEKIDQKCIFSTLEYPAVVPTGLDMSYKNYKYKREIHDRAMVLFNFLGGKGVSVAVEEPLLKHQQVWQLMISSDTKQEANNTEIIQGTGKCVWAMAVYMLYIIYYRMTLDTHINDT